MTWEEFGEGEVVCGGGFGSEIGEGGVGGRLVKVL